jgi:hypothetical protein
MKTRNKEFRMQKTSIFNKSKLYTIFNESKLYTIFNESKLYTIFNESEPKVVFDESKLCCATTCDKCRITTTDCTYPSDFPFDPASTEFYDRFTGKSTPQITYKENCEFHSRYTTPQRGEEEPNHAPERTRKYILRPVCTTRTSHDLFERGKNEKVVRIASPLSREHDVH